MRIWERPRKSILLLKDLLTIRERIVSAENRFKVPLNEKRNFYTKADMKYFDGLHTGIMKSLDAARSKVERELDRVSKEDALVTKNLALLKSIPGIGQIISLYLITATKEFSMFTTPKQLGTYIGVFPFPYGSGTSIGKEHVSKIANKKLKSLFHIAAVASIGKGREFHKYYNRKKEEGKHSMSVLNAIRYKLVKRVVSVIRRETPYIKGDTAFAKARKKRQIAL